MASSLLGRVFDAVLGQVNRTAGLNSLPYSPDTPEHLPRGGWRIVHYGVMIPGLPDPVRFFDVIAVLGTASRVPIFGVPSLVRTSPDDSAWLLVGSAASRDNFRPYSIAAECDFADDGAMLRFGDTLRIDRSPDAVRVSATPPGLRADLTLRPTATISHFVHIPGIYDHWSILCEYEGTLTPDVPGSEPIRSSGLCTYEYARGRADIPLPMYFFTYQIFDVGPRTQVLMSEVFGPGNLPVHRVVYVRDLDGNHATYARGFVNTVGEYLPAARTPDGVDMLLPKRFHWRVDDDNGDELIRIDGITNDDFAYGMAAGFAGSYDFTGHFRGVDIDGRGYIEWIDRRTGR